MSDCNHDCSSCAEKCGQEGAKQSLEAPANELSRVKKVIAVVSGKGGVGKSLITSLLAVSAAKKGKTVAVLDADITGPSIPKAFGITQKAQGDGTFIFPAVSEGGVKIISVNMMLEDETQPVVWRGPVISNMVKQFWSDVAWGDVDDMFVDMPPGTGDVPLTVFQSLPVDGIIIVTSPQELVGMIVAKAVNMAKKMEIPILGLVENMSYLVCPDCGKHINVFGEGHVEEAAAEHGIKVLAQIPIDPRIAQMVDAGRVEYLEMPWFEQAVKAVEAL